MTEGHGIISPDIIGKEVFTMTIKIGILGYGNLGKGVECAIKHNPDMELAAVFTRRNPDSLKIQTEGVKVYSVADAPAMKDQIDVLIICGGSATDLPKQTPEMAKYFNVIDSFDTHAKVTEHFANVDQDCCRCGLPQERSLPGWCTVLHP